MGLFNRNKPKGIEIANAINVNDVDTSTVCRPFVFNFKPGKQDFSSLVLYAIMERIYGGMRNVTFTTTERNILGAEINGFIERNLETLLWHYWNKGMMVVIDDGKARMRLPNMNELRYDQYGRVLNKNAVVVYSDLYVIDRDTHTMIAKPYLKSINTNLNNVEYISEQCGLFGIISSKSIPLNPAGKAEIQEKLRKDYGTGRDQFNFILSNADVNFTPITVPAKDLELMEKADADAKWLCRLFQLNPDLMFGGSTFSNQEEAYRSFYRDCVCPLAEKLLMLARALFVRNSDTLVPSSVMTYNLNNVPEMNKNLSERCNELTAYVDYLLKLRDAGYNVSERMKALADSAGELMKV